jgi:hypothetical protein
MIKKKLLAAALVTLCPVAAFAGTYNAHVAGAPDSTVTMSVTFAGDGATQETEFQATYDNSLVQIHTPVASIPGADLCFADPGAGTIRVVPRSGGGVPLPATPTVYCSFSVDIDAAAPDGTNYPLTVTLIECLDGLAADQPCSVSSPSGVTIQTAPPDVTLTYDPAPGSAINFGGGPIGGTANQSITINAGGTVGSGEVTSCSLSGAGAGSFSLAGNAFPISVAAGASGSIALACTRGAAAATATLTCVENDSDSTDVDRTWTLNCPVGDPDPVAPTITANPASGTSFSVGGASVGSMGLFTIDLIASGGVGTGQTDISCTSTGTVQIAFAPTTPAGAGPINQSVIGAAQPADLRVGVVLTNASQSPAGTITCTVSGQAPLTWTVNAPAGTTFTPPTVIPSASTWSKIALFGLLGLFGVLAFRRYS